MPRRNKRGSRNIAINTLTHEDELIDEFGNIYRFRWSVIDGISVLTTNNIMTTKSLYDSLVKAGKDKNITYDLRRNALIEKFDGIKKEEILNKIKIDMQSAKQAQKDAEKDRKKIKQEMAKK